MPEPAARRAHHERRCHLIEQLAGFGPRPPVLISTGGDVMRRSDLVELVGAARRVGLPVALAPSVTSRLKTGPLVELRHLGVSSVSLSLDGATAATHEAVRGVHGHFVAKPSRRARSPNPTMLKGTKISIRALSWQFSPGYRSSSGGGLLPRVPRAVPGPGARCLVLGAAT